VRGGKAPSQKSIPCPFSFKRELKGGEASLIYPIPLPLVKGKGIKGIGIPVKI